MNEIRKKRTFRATDTKYRMIQEYARIKGRTVSGFMVSAAMCEINKHVRREGLEQLIRAVVLEELKVAGTRGETGQAGSNQRICAERLKKERQS